MKKQRLIIVLVIIFAVAVVLFAPFRITKYDDGGTREYSALTYKIVVWNRFNDVVDAGGEVVSSGKHKGVSVYLYPDNQKSIDELWKIEMAQNV